MEKTQFALVKESVEYVKNRIELQPKIGIVGGSGLDISSLVNNPTKIAYKDIPNFPLSTAPGHKGEFIVGSVSGKTVMVMNGRVHYYEGYSMKTVTFPIRVMKELGVDILILTNAAGGLNPNYERGRLMLISDHINFMGTNPLIGENFEEWGPRFPDMSNAYDKELRRKVKDVARRLDIPLYEGVYIAFTGPSFETAAELKMSQTMKADAVGMSTVPEVIVANHMGMKVIGLSCITDRAVPEDLKPLTAEEVLKVASSCEEYLMKLLPEIIKELPI